MDKEQILRIFDTKLSEFVKDLISIYPEDKDLYAFKNSIKLVNLVNDTQCITIFKEYVYEPYSDKILGKNEDFFLKHDFDKEKNTNQNFEFTNQLIAKIKGYWATMSSENKETIWKYFTLLLRLCEKYFI